MKQLFVKIKTPNQQILIKKRIVRTPVNFIIFESEKSNLEFTLKQKYITDYVIEDFDENKNVKPSTSILKTIKTPTTKTKKETSIKTGTSLDNFIN